jgi:hypothetical protein
VKESFYLVAFLDGKFVLMSKTKLCMCDIHKDFNILSETVESYMKAGIDFPVPMPEIQKFVNFYHEYTQQCVR